MVNLNNMENLKFYTVILMLLCLITNCNSKKSIDVEKIQCSEKIFLGDTLQYISKIKINNKFSIEINTVLYDTIVIPTESMGIEDNVKNQKIYFKKDDKIVKSYVIPSEKHSIWDIYMIDSLKNTSKMLAINKIYDVSVIKLNENKIFYFFEGGENLIDKSDYTLITDQEGNVIYEKYKSRKGSLKDFLAKINMLEAWENDELYLNKICFYPYKLCGQQNTQITWIN